MARQPTSFYIDPAKRTEVMEEYGVQTLPEFQGSAYNLRDVPNYEDLRQSTVDYGRHSDLYTLLTGGFPIADTADPIQDFTGGETIDTGVGGANIVDQLGTVDTGPEQINIDTPLTQMITDPTTGQTQTVRQAMTSDDAYRGVDTTPGDLEPSFEGLDYDDITPDYSGVGLTSPKRSGMDTVIRDAPVNLIEQDIGSQHPMAKEAVGTIPPDTIGPQPVNIIERDPMGHPMAKEAVGTTPTNVIGPLDYLQPEETFQEKLDRYTIPAGRVVDTPGGTITVNEETGDVQQPGIIGDVVEEPTLEQEISQAPMDPTMMIPQVPPYTDRIMDPELMDIQQQNFETLPTEEKTNMLQDALSKAQGMGGDLMGNFQDNLLTTGKFSPSQLTSLISTIMNPSAWSVAGALGIPGIILGGIGKALGAVGDFLPQYEPTFEERTLEEELGVTEEGKFAGDPSTSAFAGKNAVSMFGDPVESAKDRIDTRLENIENKGYTVGDKFYDDTMKMIEEWEAVTDKLGDIGPTGDARAAEEAQEETREEYRDRIAEVTTGDAAEAERIAAENRAAELQKELETYRDPIMDMPAPTPSYSRPSPHDGGFGGRGDRGDRGGGFDPGGGTFGSPFARGGRVRYGLGSLRKRRY